MFLRKKNVIEKNNSNIEVKFYGCGLLKERVCILFIVCFEFGELIVNFLLVSDN